MNLGEWVRERMVECRASKKDVLTDLAGRSGVSFLTLETTARGALMGNYRKAVAIQRATGGEVTVIDLCDSDPETTVRDIIRKYSEGK